MTKAHEEKETLAVEVNIPEHPDRTTTALFTHSKKQLIERDGETCYICGEGPDKVGPLEAHHYLIERSLTDMIDWERVKADALAGNFGMTQAQRDAAKAFDWDGFSEADPYAFVDNMLVNGVLICKHHHTGKDEGIHNMPHPLWIAQRYGREGYRFSGVEVLDHAG